jgi:hypothetical protein
MTLVFLTAFFAALVMLGIESGRSLPNPTNNPLAGLPGQPPLPGEAVRNFKMIAYGALAAAMAAATVATMATSGPRGGVIPRDPSWFDPKNSDDNN